jgi:hypothetical protein
MSILIQKLLREALNELHLTQKFKTTSYPARVENAWIGKPLPPTAENFEKIPLPQDVLNEIKNRVLNLEKIQFAVTNAGLGILVYTSKDRVFYDDYPKKQLDHGVDLFTIVRDNEANTIYWKPAGFKPRDIQTYIRYEDLMNYIKDKNIGTTSKPITLNTIQTIRNLTKR